METERKNKKTSTYCGHVEDDIVPCSRVRMQGNCFQMNQMTRWLCVTDEQ